MTDNPPDDNWKPLGEIVKKIIDQVKEIKNEPTA